MARLDSSPVCPHALLEQPSSKNENKIELLYELQTLLNAKLLLFFFGGVGGLALTVARS
jgi:hypothetical protein